MKKLRKAIQLITILLFGIAATTNVMQQNISILFLTLLIVLVFGIYPLIVKVFYDKCPKVTGRVSRVDSGRFYRRPTATIEFEYKGQIYEIEERYNDEDLPKLNSELNIIVDVRNIHNSVVHELGNTSLFINIIISVLAIVFLLFKYFNVTI